MWNPLSWVMEAAAVMAIVLANGGVSGLIFLPLLFSFFFHIFLLLLCCNRFQHVSFSCITPLLEMIFQGQGPDWQDFVGIICLLLINSTISFIEENNAGNAAAALMAHLAPKTKVSPFGW